MERLKQLLQVRHEEGIKLKKEGHRLIGYFCSYCPEEIIYAAGLIPVRIFGSPASYPNQTKHLQSYYCAHCHGCLETGLRGDYDYLDGIVLPYACDHTRAAYESWRVNKPLKYARFIDIPSQVDTKIAQDFFIHELKSFTSSLEKEFQVEITPERIAQGISLCNENRRLLRRLFQFKKDENSPISGLDTFYAILSSTICHKGRHNEILTDCLAQANARKVDRSGKKRFMLMGSELHDDQIITYLESNGALVASDELCTGTRYIWTDVEERKEVFQALAERYLLGVNCPIKRPGTLRFNHIERMLDEFKINAAIMLHPKNCDPLSWEEPFIKKLLDQRGIPFIFLETETDQTMRILAQNLELVMGIPSN